jgi:hypothetical protein
MAVRDICSYLSAPVLPKLGKNFCCNLLELLFRKFEMFATEIDVSLALHGDEMNMCMRHLQTEHHLCHLATGESTLYGNSDALGKLLITSNFIVVHIENIVYLTTGNHQCVPFYQWIDVEESIELLILGAFVTGNLSRSNF